MEKILNQRNGKVKLINRYPDVLTVEKVSEGLYELKFKWAV